MRVLFYMPRDVIDRCFCRRDLKRLSAGCAVTMPGPDINGDALDNYGVEHLQTCNALVTGWDTPPLSDAMLDDSGDLNVWIHAAGSVKHLLPDSFWRREIALASCRDALAVGVAETALGMTIAGVKRFFPAERLTRAGGWKEDAWATSLGVRELFDLRIGVVGASCVGRHFIRLLHAFEVSVAVYDPYLSRADAAALGVEPLGLDDLMRTSDVVSLHAPALPETRHMIGAAQLSLMRDGAVLVNTARGSLIDEHALVAELKTGRMVAMLDVTDPEPPAANHPLRSLPNCVMTPHIAGAVANGCFRIGRSAVNQLLSFAAGEPMSGRITQQHLAALG